MRKIDCNRKSYYREMTGGGKPAILCWFIIFILLAGGVQTGDAGNGRQQWTYINRVVLTGSSDHSDPANYRVYSAFTLEAAVRRQFTPSLSAEFNFKTESREVDITDNAGTVTNLGSIELLPLNLILRYHIPPKGGFHPYFGVGGNFTVCWEKSGFLDNKDLTPSFGPALQLGADFDLASYILFNIDIKWNSMRTDIEENGKNLVRLKLDPINFVAGIGFSF
ncbi:MAG: OmpW family outer membrane protein [Calditrichota bacterium]